MPTAHNTLIQFLHDHPEWLLKIEKRTGWHVSLYAPDGTSIFWQIDKSYEAACANLAAQLPKL